MSGLPEIAQEFARRVQARALDLPLPGNGATAARWRALADVARIDLCLAKLAEAHADADAILAELAGKRVGPGERWAVWAAESPDAATLARVDGDRPHGWRVDGRKAWCSGAALCTHALITAASDDGPMLLAVDLAHPGVLVSQARFWVGPGMARAGTTEIELDAVPAEPIGRPGEYLSRPGFWHGAIGVAAVWLGGAGALGGALLERGRAGRLDAHGLAHLGAVDAALTGAWALLDDLGARIDADPTADRMVDALRARAVVEDAATDVLRRVERALGPGPLATDQAFATLAGDLPVYLRQSHAERDLAQLGDAVSGAGEGTGRATW